MSEGQVSSLTSSLEDSYDRLRFDAGRYELSHSCLVELKGDDRRAWLQGMVTNDLRKVQEGDSSAFCMCTPTGQMIAACELWSLPGRFLMRAHRQSLLPIMQKVEQMVIMEDVHAADLTPDYRFVSIQGPSATKLLKDIVDLPLLDAGVSELEGSEIICLRSNRTGLGGWDLLLPHDAKKAIKLLERSFDPVTEEAFEAARLEAGVPRFGTDMNEKTLPPEMGPAFEVRHISYSKGCYTGQEVLMRLHSRGHTNKTWMGLVSDQAMKAGQLIGHQKRDDSGVITSVAYSPQFGFIAGAMLRTEAAFDGEIVRVQGADGAFEAEVRPFPLLLLA